MAPQRYRTPNGEPAYAYTVAPRLPPMLAWVIKRNALTVEIGVRWLPTMSETKRQVSPRLIRPWRPEDSRAWDSTYANAIKKRS